MNQKDIDFLEAKGWIVECESPLEIRDNETGSFATGYAAKCVLESLRNEENESDIKFEINEKIKELALKANPKNIFKEFERDDIAFCEKFAELIVTECANVPTLMWLSNEVNADVAVKIRNRILDNFELKDDSDD